MNNAIKNELIRSDLPKYQLNRVKNYKHGGYKSYYMKIEMFEIAINHFL